MGDRFCKGDLFIYLLMSKIANNDGANRNTQQKIIIIIVLF